MKEAFSGQVQKAITTGGTLHGVTRVQGGQALSHPALLSRQTAPSLGLTEHGVTLPPPHTRSPKVSPYMGTSALPSVFHSLIVPLGMGWVYFSF